VVLRSGRGGRCRLGYRDRRLELETRAGEQYVLDGELAALEPTV
jgi:hypothetical protein